MNSLIDIIKLAAIASSSIMLGRWFLQEVRIARAKQLPWYAPYISPPGVLVLLASLLPVLVWLIRK